MKPTLKSIPGDQMPKDEPNTQYRKVQPHKPLMPPNFPNDSEREIVHGTLGAWLKRLAKKEK